MPDPLALGCAAVFTALIGAIAWMNVYVRRHAPPRQPGPETQEEWNERQW